MNPVFDVVDAVDGLCKKVGSSIPQYRLCKAILTRPGLKITDYGRLINAACPTMTDTVDRAERNGWVKRVRSAEDRRVVILELADPVRFNALESLVQEAIGHMPEGVADYLNRTAQRLTA